MNIWKVSRKGGCCVFEAIFAGVFTEYSWDFEDLKLVCSQTPPSQPRHALRRKLPNCSYSAIAPNLGEEPVYLFDVNAIILAINILTHYWFLNEQGNL